VPLRFVGVEAPPAAAPAPTALARRSPAAAAPFPARLRVPLRAALAGGLLLAAAWVVAHGRRRGLFRRLPDPATVDEAFLREHVLSRAAEVIGGAWDGRIGGAEVSAVIARMALERKLEARVEPGFLGLTRVLHLRLLVDRATLSGDERALAQGLFPLGDTIDSDALRRHYRRRGFRPAQRLVRAAKAVASLDRERPPRRWPFALAALGLVAVAAWLASRALVAGEPIEPLAVALFCWPLLVLGVVGAWGLAGRTRGRWPFAAAAVIPWLGWAWAIDALAGGAMGAGPLAVATHLCAWAACLVLTASLARTSFAPETVALRRRLELARRFLARELAAPSPRLRDDWIPYLVALGLGGRVDRWIRVHGAGPRAGGSFAGGGSAVGAGGWSGGGGRFSGGGASGSWAALGGLASVAAPSSSRGRSGGSSGGSSSGGGGGGGW
jgi:uncharacterized membrane protein YgcG